MKKLLSIFIISFLLLNAYANSGENFDKIKNYNEKIKKEDYRDLLNLKNDEYSGIFKDKSILILAVDGLYSDLIDENSAPFLNSLKNTSFYFQNSHLTTMTSIQDDSVLTNLYALYPRVRSFGKNYISARDVKGLQNYANEMGFRSHFISTKGKYYLDFSKMGFSNRVVVSENNFKSELLKTLNKNEKKFVYSVVSKRGSDIKSLDSLLKDLVESIKNTENGKDLEFIIVGTNSQSTKASSFKLEGVDASKVPVIFISEKLPKKSFEDSVSNIDIMPTILNFMGVKSTYPNYGEYIYSREFPVTVMTNDKLRYITDGNFLIEVRENVPLSKSKVLDIKSNSNLDPSGFKEIIYKSFIDSDMSEGLTTLNQNRLVYLNRENVPSIPQNKEDMIIMHAGGFIAGVNYSNMKDALDYHYNMGRRYFELDIERSSDGKLVLIHDFGGYQSKFFNVTENKSFTFKEFLEFESVHGFSQMDMESLVNFLRDKKDAYIVTDIKDENIKTLQMIAETAPEIMDRMIPQIYDFSEYAEVKKIGYKNIILTLYKMNKKPEEVIEFIKTHPLYAVTISKSIVDSKIGAALKTQNIKIFTHTVNTMEEVKKLRKSGITGFYSDVL